MFTPRDGSLARAALLHTARSVNRRERFILLPLSLAICQLLIPAHAATTIPSGTSPVTLSTDTSYQLNAGSSVSVATQNTAITVNGIAPVTFLNAGTIKGGPVGSSFVAGIWFNVQGLLTNQASGSILGSTYGVYMNNSSANNSIINYGDISSTNNHTITFDGGAGGTIDNYGTLNNSPSTGSVVDAMYMTSTGAITVNNHTGATLKSGTGNPSYSNVIVLTPSQTGAFTLNNDGLITGYNVAYLSTSNATQTINNNASGVIRSTTINAAIDTTTNTSIVNAGTLSSATMSAILLRGANNHITLNTGSILSGAGGNVVESRGTGNTIALTGNGTENGNFINTAGNAFQSLTMQGSSWTLGGNLNLAGTAANALSVQSGALTLAGAVNGPGATINAGSTLQLGGGGTTGSFSGNITDNAALIFNRSNTVTYGGLISDTGTVTQAGTGILNLAGANTRRNSTVARLARGHNLNWASRAR